MPMTLLRTLLATTFVRYGLASVVALASDVALFLAFLRGGFTPAAASALGYGFGILVHWLISSRLVFAEGAAPRGPERTRQKGLFVGAALVGLALTTGIVALGSIIGLLPIVAKLIAIVVSFQTTYLLRKAFVFAP
ncbi:MAG: polysaccharide biosynthesis protein GtrA [Sphingobium sp. 66-54]|nr:MAG: polysaccharide biosynthesis protein GtrA [Sphingobium sp. 66-54]